MYYSLTLIIALLLLPSLGWGLGTSQDVPGTTLLQECSATIDEMGGQRLTPDAQAESASCLARIEGFLGAYYLALDRTAMAPWFCLPAEATVGQLVRVVVQYMQTPPEKGGAQAAHVIFLALQDAFPCPAKSP